MKIIHLLLLCLSGFLVSSCDRNKPVSAIPETKSSFQKILFTQPQTGETIRLISETKCEIDDQKGTILLADYSREENKLRVVTRVAGTDSVQYYDITQDGLRASNGQALLLPEALNKLRAEQMEQARKSREAQLEREKKIREAQLEKVRQLRMETERIMALPPFALIPAGEFVMGDAVEAGQYATPHRVILSAYYMQTKEVTKAQWNEVRDWALQHGYIDLVEGVGSAADHPVHDVTWLDVVKWCNAKSEKEGLVPCYYTDTQHMKIFRSGNANLTNEMVKWNVNGYRLPTEAEWEKSARGGLSGKRFPWGDVITHDNANFNNNGGEDYASSGLGYHPAYIAGEIGGTSPVWCFAPNGYGLYNMAGNVSEWCWDWYGDYSPALQRDPRGASSGAVRIFRGGDWGTCASACRVAGSHDVSAGQVAYAMHLNSLSSGYPAPYNPSDPKNRIGFRMVRCSPESGTTRTQGESGDNDTTGKSVPTDPNNSPPNNIQPAVLEANQTSGDQQKQKSAELDAPQTEGKLIFTDDFSQSGNAWDPKLPSNRCFSFKGAKQFEIAVKDLMPPGKTEALLRFKWLAPQGNLSQWGNSEKAILQFDFYNTRGSRMMYQPQTQISTTWQDFSFKARIAPDAERIIVWNKWNDIDMCVDDFQIIAVDSADQNAARFQSPNDSIKKTKTPAGIFCNTTLSYGSHMSDWTFYFGNGESGQCPYFAKQFRAPGGTEEGTNTYKIDSLGNKKWQITTLGKTPDGIRNINIVFWIDRVNPHAPDNQTVIEATGNIYYNGNPIWPQGEKATKLVFKRGKHLQ